VNKISGKADSNFRPFYINSGLSSRKLTSASLMRTPPPKVQKFCHHSLLLHLSHFWLIWLWNVLCRNVWAVDRTGRHDERNAFIAYWNRFVHVVEIIGTNTHKAAKFSPPWTSNRSLRRIDWDVVDSGCLINSFLCHLQDAVPGSRYRDRYVAYTVYGLYIPVCFYSCWLKASFFLTEKSL